jgi:hypothetical protein
LKVGLGDIDAQFNVYIANRPHFSDMSALNTIAPCVSGEISAIGQTCGNGWRKVFNVFAKLIFALNLEQLVSLNEVGSWQDYRDQYLLQSSSNTSLLFSPPPIEISHNQNQVHIIMGKTYAKQITNPGSLVWLDDEFAFDKSRHLWVCPYFDYRQLSNIKIIRLVELIRLQCLLS